MTEVPVPAARTEWASPELGAHDREILGERLGLSDGALADLAARRAT